MKMFYDKNTNDYKVQINNGSAALSLSDAYLGDLEKEEGFKAEDKNELILDKYNERVSSFRSIWDNNGLDQEGTEWSIKDMYSTPDAPWMMPKIVSEQAAEAIEPMLLMTEMMHKIQYTMGQTILLPSSGALSATNLDMAEGDEYPETKLASGGGSQMIANIGKVGLSVKVTEEMIRYSQFDVIGLHVKAAGRALARHKEVKAANMVAGQGVCYYDNLNPSEAVLGVLHGRNSDGSANGSVVAEDFLDLEGELVAKGFMPNTMILHPLAYTMFRKDPILRAFFMDGRSTTYFGTYSGNAAGGNPWGGNLGGMGRGTQQKINSDTDPKLRNQDINSAPSIPGYWGIDLSILVTPYVKYSPITKLTDIILCDRNELGVLLVDEELTTEDWKDPARDIMKMKFRERYCFGLLNEGQSVAVMKNVKNVPNKIIDEPARPKYDVTVDMADINPRVALSL